MQRHSKLVKPLATKPFPQSPSPDHAWASPVDQRIYQLLQEAGPLSRDVLVDRSGIARTTIYDALMRLRLQGLVLRFKEPRQTRGAAGWFLPAFGSHDF
ncbi:MAG: winged helix-turn-helix domain-containing protein [Candidatus Heimdallarchaeota archaeon]